MLIDFQQVVLCRFQIPKIKKTDFQTTVRLDFFFLLGLPASSSTLEVKSAVEDSFIQLEAQCIIKAGGFAI